MPGDDPRDSCVFDLITMWSWQRLPPPRISPNGLADIADAESWQFYLDYLSADPVKMKNIATVICYCTNDYRYIGKCIEEALKFSDQILVPVCDHFFDGTPENKQLLQQTYAEHPHIQFIEFPYGDTLYAPHIQITQDHPNWPKYWHSTARLIGFFHTQEAIDWILFLDTDEICDGKRMLDWLESTDLNLYTAHRPLQYRYVKSPAHPWIKFEVSSLLVKKALLTPTMIFNPQERYGIQKALPGKQVIGATHDGLPLVHHYSWVKTQQEILTKTRTWGHRDDAPWQTLLDREYSLPQSDQTPSFIFPEPTTTVEPFFDPFAVAPSLSAALETQNITYTNRLDTYRHWLIHDNFYDRIDP